MGLYSINAAQLRRCCGAAALALSMGIGGMGMAMAQAPGTEILRNVVHITASGSVEVDQDWLTMSLSTSKEGSDAAAVQKQLQQVVDAALRSLKSQEQGQSLQVRTGSFGVYPRHGNDGKIKGWQGRADLVVEGKDFARIGKAVANVDGMSVANVSFGLSKEGAQKVQDEAQAKAIEAFKSRAGLVAQQFGFASYALREVHINSQDGFAAPRAMRVTAMAAAPKMEMADPVPVEAGKAEVTVSVNGSVQLQ